MENHMKVTLTLLALCEN